VFGLADNRRSTTIAADAPAADVAADEAVVVAAAGEEASS
jgi:hypothetical protein